MHFFFQEGLYYSGKFRAVAAPAFHKTYFLLMSYSMKLCKWGLGGTHCRRGRWAFPSSQPYMRTQGDEKERDGGGKRRLCCIILQGNDWRKWSFRSSFSRVHTVHSAVFLQQNLFAFLGSVCLSYKARDVT